MTKLAVEIRHATPEIKQEFPSLNELPLLDIYPSVRRICLWLPDEAISDADLTHEMIHLRRNILESVPRLVPLRTARNHEAIYALENDLEHLTVVPEEISYFPDSASKWAGQYRRYVTEASANAFDLFRHWTVSNYVLPQERDLLLECKRKLNAAGLFRDADEFKNQVVAAFPDKGNMINVALDWFTKVRADVSIERFVMTEQGLDCVLL